MTQDERDRLFAVDELVGFARAALVSQGVPEPDAALVARSLVEADQRGIGSHGLLRLPLYVSALRHGGISARPQLRFENADGATGTLDGDAGLGQVVMQAAVDWSLDHAAAHGVSALAVHNSSHYGAGQFWTDQLAAQGMIGILTSTTGPVTAPYGGVRTVLGTNPLTVAMPSTGDPLTVDMATSAGALGKVMAAKQAGREIPTGWAVDAQGEPTTDPDAAIGGALLPFGGHKGSGLSVLLEGLSAALTPATFAFDTQDIWESPDARMNNGHLLLVLDTGAFAGRSTVEARVDDLAGAVHGAGTDVLVPGEKEYALHRRHAERLTLGAGLVADLRVLARDLGMELPAPAETDGTETTAMEES
jgi:LDH2 family malate/lactate/ureidoglycolate dehydrogenase